MKILHALVLIVLLRTLPVWAMPIDPIDTVTVNGTQWAQMDLFTNLSWNDINAVCPGGDCGAGTLNGYSMAGWYWAGVEDMNALYNVYLADAGVTGNDLLGPIDADQYWQSGSTAVEQFLLDFRLTWESCDPPPDGCTIFELSAWTRDSTVVQQLHVSYVSSVRNRVNPFGADGMLTDVTVLRTSRSAMFGANFYRRQSVPSPSSLVLLALGLMVIGLNRMLRQALEL